MSNPYGIQGLRFNQDYGMFLAQYSHSQIFFKTLKYICIYLFVCSLLYCGLGVRTSDLQREPTRGKASTWYAAVTFLIDIIHSTKETN